MGGRKPCRLMASASVPVCKPVRASSLDLQRVWKLIQLTQLEATMVESLASDCVLALVLSVVDGVPTTTSLDIARHFNRPHDEVLRRIRNLLAQLDGEYLRNFAEVTHEYSNGKGGTQTAPAYRLTRDGFTLLAMGFTGKKALQFKLAYIDAFNRMEAQLRSAASLKQVDGKHLQGAGKRLTPQQCEAAVQAGGVASLQVQMALARGVLDGGDDWKHQRWLVSFVPDSKVGAPPVVELLPADALMLTKTEVMQLMGEIAGASWADMWARVNVKKVGA